MTDSQFSSSNFFDLKGSPLLSFFNRLSYVWESVALIPEYIKDNISPKNEGYLEEGSWIDETSVQIGKGSVIERGAIVRGPTIIGEGVTVRSGAYIRGDVYIGDRSVVGHGTEIHTSIILNDSNMRHHNVILSSIVGNRVNVSGYTALANMLLSQKEVKIHVPHGSENSRLSYPTGLKLFGAVIGDDTIIGAKSLISPGSIIERGCSIGSMIPFVGYLRAGKTIKTNAVREENL